MWTKSKALRLNSGDFSAGVTARLSSKEYFQGRGPANWVKPVRAAELFHPDVFAGDRTLCSVVVATAPDFSPTET